MEVELESTGIHHRKCIEKSHMKWTSKILDLDIGQRKCASLQIFYLLISLLTHIKLSLNFVANSTNYFQLLCQDQIL